jgi:hypothetical protein
MIFISIIHQLYTMFLQDRESGTLVKILDIEALFSPLENAVSGQIQAGEEEQDPEAFEKEALIFPSGEKSPRCWLDANYRNTLSG